MDNRGENLLCHLDGAAAFIDAGQYHGAVLVHCHKGVSRSASVVAAYLMKSQGWGLDAAMAHLKAARPSVSPHEAFMEQLAQYDRQQQVSAAVLSSGNITRAESLHTSDVLHTFGPCV
jgi:protein-tyrosine phosphatase